MVPRHDQDNRIIVRTSILEKYDSDMTFYNFFETMIPRSFFYENYKILQALIWKTGKIDTIIIRFRHSHMQEHAFSTF